MSSGPLVDDQASIQRMLGRLRESTHLPLAFGGVPDAAGRLPLELFAGPVAGPLRGAVLEPGRGLGGKVVASQRPQLVKDYVDSSRISHHYDHIIEAEGLRAMAAVPVVVGKRVRGVIYGALRAAVPLGDRTVNSVVDAAREAEQAIAVRDELGRRADWLARQAAADQEAPEGGKQWEQVREAYAELRVLANELADNGMRERVDAVCDRLSSARSVAGAGPPPALSRRELDVLGCVALGWTNGHIAVDLGITQETVKSYLRSAARKLQSRTRMEAVVTARRVGLLP